MKPEGLKIWHQSLTDLSAVPGYRQSLTAIAAYVGQPGTRVEIHGVVPGTFPAGTAPVIALRSRWIEQLLATQLIKNALTAEAEGYDAVSVSCFFDPGLEEARELVGIPVVSACETSLTVALGMGRHAVLTALDAHQAVALRRVVKRLGLQDLVTAVVPLSPYITDLEIEAGVPIDDLVRRHELALATVEISGPTVLIPAEGVLNAALSAAGIHSIAGLPVIDSFASVVAHAEMLSRLGATTGIGLHTGASHDDVRKHIETIAAVVLVRD